MGIICTLGQKEIQFLCWNSVFPNVEKLGESCWYSRVIHEVVDFPHGYASHVDKKDKAEKHQVVFRRHPQHELQVESVQLRQEELRSAQIK